MIVVWVLCGAAEGPTGHGKVMRTREITIAEIGTDKPRLEAALKYSRSGSRVLSGRSRVEVFVYMGFVAHLSWREEEEKVSAGMTAFARFKKGSK
jgi:hypothetical protein